MSNIKMASYEMDAIEVLNSDTLKELKEKIEKELKNRENVRRDELIKNVCDAMNALYEEFSHVELRVETKCGYCEAEDEIDVIDYFCGGRKLTPKDFYAW